MIITDILYNMCCITINIKHHRKRIPCKIQFLQQFIKRGIINSDKISGGIKNINYKKWWELVSPYPSTTANNIIGIWLKL